MARRGQIRIRVELRTRVTTRRSTLTPIYEPSFASSLERTSARCLECGEMTDLPYVGYRGQLLCDGCDQPLALP